MKKTLSAFVTVLLLTSASYAAAKHEVSKKVDNQDMHMDCQMGCGKHMHEPMKDMSLSLSVDAVLAGRVAIEYQWNINKTLSLVFPLSFEAPDLSLAAQISSRYASVIRKYYWAAMTGVGLKIRLGNMHKASFYLMPRVGMGLGSYVNQANTVRTTAFGIDPGLYVGMEKTFKNGVFLDCRSGIEKNILINSTADMRVLHFSTSMGVGYAW